jgi:soluble lytic murein transglycosylase-like protein
MAQLPDAAALGERPVPQSAGAVAQYEPPNWRQVGMSGQIIQGAGRDLEEASQVIAATNDRQDQIVAQAAANNLQQKATQFEFDPSKGFRNQKEGNAVGKGFLDTNTQQFTDATTQLRGALLNDNQRRVFDQHAAVLGTRYQAALLAHQAQETDKFNDSTDDNSLKLALQSMATRPQDELNFQTGMAQIDGTIDALGKRKGLPAAQVSQLKAQYLDAAYSTRITTIMNGLPGVTQANPYEAEKMFRQVQDQLGPASQVHLASQVQKAVQSVQARDTASALIFGRAPVKPDVIAPAATGLPLQAVVMDMESGGNPNAVSPKGAAGAMQVMPDTATNPGFGVWPAKMGPDGKPLPGELERVGRDYLGAMTARYDNPALVLAAYNAGPGTVDKWIEKYGDPRTGSVSLQDWVSKIPFAETQAYVTNGLRKLNAAAGQPDAPIQAPTAAQLKTDLYARVQYARQVAEQQYPGDTAYADTVAARTENYGRMVLSNQQAVEQGARDGLLQGVIGSKPDGSDKPSTMDQLLADPQMKRNWDNATPETKHAIQQRIAQGDKRFDASSFGTYYSLLGQASNDPATFVDADLGKLFGQIPDDKLVQLANLQKSIRTNDAKQQDKDLNWTRAKSNVEDMLKPIGLGLSAKAGTDKAKTTEVFYGKLNETIQQFHDTTGKWPQTQDVRKFAAGLLTEGKQAGGTLWDSSARAFQVEDPGKFYVPLPSERDSLSTSFERVMGHKPTDAELQRWYTQYKLGGGK